MNSTFKNPLPDDVYEQRIVPRENDVRGAYFRDQTAILHSLPFRRLKHKAQVFFAPHNDHVCTRIEHSLHVATIAATIARGLGLDSELAYAIGLGHDLGHAPFGHEGEKILAEKTKNAGGFVHELHSLRVVDFIGNRGTPLNLTYGVRDGIVCHCGEKHERELKPRSEVIDLNTIRKLNIYPCSYEGCIARMSDRIAYLGRDLEDAIYGRFIALEDVPRNVQQELGKTNGEIINTLALDVIDTSKKSGTIAMSDERFELVGELSRFSREAIYKNHRLERYKAYCERIIDSLFDYFIDLMDRNGWDFAAYDQSPVDPEKRFGRYLLSMREAYNDGSTANIEVVRDFVAGMTDDYSLRCIREIYLPDEHYFEQDL